MFGALTRYFQKLTCLPRARPWELNERLARHPRLRDRGRSPEAGSPPLEVDQSASFQVVLVSCVASFAVSLACQSAWESGRRQAPVENNRFVASTGAVLSGVNLPGGGAFLGIWLNFPKKRTPQERPAVHATTQATEVHSGPEESNTRDSLSPTAISPILSVKFFEANSSLAPLDDLSRMVQGRLRRPLAHHNVAGICEAMRRSRRLFSSLDDRGLFSTASSVSAGASASAEPSDADGTIAFPPATKGVDRSVAPRSHRSLCDGACCG